MTSTIEYHGAWGRKPHEWSPQHKRRHTIRTAMANHLGQEQDREREALADAVVRRITEQVLGPVRPEA